MKKNIKEEQKIERRKYLKDGIVAFIPTVIIISILRIFFTGFLIPLITFIVITSIVRIIREKYNIQFTKKNIIKIFFLELAFIVLIFSSIFLIIAVSENSAKEEIPIQERFRVIQEN